MLYSFIALKNEQQLFSLYKSERILNKKIISKALLAVGICFFAVFFAVVILYMLQFSISFLDAVLQNIFLLFFVSFFLIVTSYAYLKPIKKIVNFDIEQIKQYHLPDTQNYNLYNDYIEMNTTQTHTSMPWPQIERCQYYNDIIAFSHNNRLYYFSIADLEETKRIELFAFLQSKIYNFHIVK